jgi:hypothetical protein
MRLRLEYFRYRMKILLRDTQTGLFYAGPNQWTIEQDTAQDFKTPDLAFNVIDESKLNAMEIVVHFGEAAFDVPLTIVTASERNM